MPTSLQLDFVLIPAGSFIMGSDLASYRQAGADEMPQHTLTVSDFQIMRCPVTNEQYRLFIEATGHRAPQTWRNGAYGEDKAGHPVTGVAYHDAGLLPLGARGDGAAGPSAERARVGKGHAGD